MPDLVCYSAAVQACADSGQPERSLDIMRRMKRDGFVPDKKAYNTAIVSYGQRGEWELSLKIMSEMRAEGLRPDHTSYQFAMNVRTDPFLFFAFLLGCSFLV